MRELVTSKHTEYKTDIEIKCLQLSEYPSTFKCRDIKFFFSKCVFFTYVKPSIYKLS